jgi:hypothetical protein
MLVININLNEAQHSLKHFFVQAAIATHEKSFFFVNLIHINSIKAFLDVVGI